jgi:Uma2 family endonuclease
MTADEFLALPDVQGERWELVAGEIVVSPRPTRSHAYTAGELYALLREHVKQNNLGIVYIEVDTKFETYEVRAPDIQYFSNAHSPEEIRTRADLIPDLCIEILSPSNPRTDRVNKFQLYQAQGVANYWIVDPENRTIEGYTLHNGRYLDSGRAADEGVIKLPPFLAIEIPLAKIWHP